jgi:NAD-dependent dihydropyrimidine dehydrogenase PreA subunit
VWLAHLQGEIQRRIIEDWEVAAIASMGVGAQNQVRGGFPAEIFHRVSNTDGIDANLDAIEPDSIVEGFQHNLQSLPIMAYIIEVEKCTACAACVDTCPSGAISAAEGGGHYIIDPEKCVDCAACEEGCPSSAIHAGT